LFSSLSKLYNPQNTNPTFYPILIPPIQHSFCEKNLTCPIPTATGKKPKPKNQTASIKKMGWDIFEAPHPRKEKKQKRNNASLLNITPMAGWKET
jgi:hypothetical protein